MAAPTEAQLKLDQKKWEAEEDARTLDRVLSIRGDKQRMTRAKQGAARILKRDAERLKEQQQEMAALKRVAKDNNFFDYDEGEDNNT